MKQAEFQKLLEGNLISGTEEALKANIDDILNQFKEATEEDREGFFDSLFHSTRYDVMKTLVDQKIANEFELYNIALKCKIDDLRGGVDTDSIQNRVHKAALDQLDEERIPEFYSALVDQLFIDRKNKVQLPRAETLQELYEWLFIGGHGQALRKLHNFLGYYRGTEGQNSEELIAAVKADDQKEALKLISQGHYVYDFTKLDFLKEEKLYRFFFHNNLHHPNCNLIATDKGGWAPLHFAARNGYTEIVKAILEAAKGNVNLLGVPFAPDKFGYTPLHWAAIKGRTEILKLLLEKGADINAKAIGGHTPLHEAAEYGHTEIVKLLLEKGADINAKNYYGKTPLHWAVFKGHTEIVKLLLEKGADVHAKPDYGDIPMHKAAEYGYTEIVKLLLAHGACPPLSILLNNTFSTEMNSILRSGFIKSHAHGAHKAFSTGWNILEGASKALSGDITEFYDEQAKHKPNQASQEQNQNNNQR